jgi:integrase
VDDAAIRRFVEAKLAAGLNSATVRVHVSLLSGLFEHLREQRIAERNPCKGLPGSLRRLLKPSHDPRTTPFVEKLADVRRIFLDLTERNEGLGVAYAIGALAGLRTGEVFALRWENVDLAGKRIHVRESVAGPTKDKDSRVVPILAPLLPILTAWKLKTGGTGIVIPSMRRDGKRIGYRHTPGKFLAATLAKLNLAKPGLGWYQAGRHTFASQWVIGGGSIETLRVMMGHYSVQMTERYAHLRPDLIGERDLGAIKLDLAPGAAAPVELGARTVPGRRKAAAST